MADSMKVALTVAGSDSGAGAGIQADIFTFASNGVYATSAITALTAQNPDGVRSVYASSPESLRDQLEAVYEYYKPSAAKCGMLFSEGLVGVVADFFAKHREISLVVDPVMISTSGSVLLEETAVKKLIESLCPLADLVTPNLDEASHMLKCARIARSQMEARALELSDMLGVSVLLKGGHLVEGGDLLDVLAVNGKIHKFTVTRLEDINSHGGGCTLSAAITARLALGDSLENACARARTYLFDAMSKPVRLLEDSFINHFPNL